MTTRPCRCLATPDRSVARRVLHKKALIFWLLCVTLPGGTNARETASSVRMFLEAHPEFLLQHPALVDKALAAQRAGNLAQEGQRRNQIIADLRSFSGVTGAASGSAGHSRLVFFGFTHCPDVCPNTLSHIAQTLSLLKDRAAEVQTFFISVDHERDTPEVLKRYVHFFHPDITGLSGTEEQLNRAQSAFSVHSQRYIASDDAEEYTFSHSSWIFLINDRGDILTRFSYDTPPQAMVTAILQFIEPEHG